MSKKVDRNKFKCPISYTMTVLGGKWRSLILWHINQTPLRFSEVQKIVPGISRKVLTEHLKALEENDLINRTVYPEVPPKVVYNITAKGQTLIPILQLMDDWGNAPH